MSRRRYKRNKTWKWEAAAKADRKDHDWDFSIRACKRCGCTLTYSTNGLIKQSRPCIP